MDGADDFIKAGEWMVQMVVSKQELMVQMVVSKLGMDGTDGFLSKLGMYCTDEFIKARIRWYIWFIKARNG